MEKSVSIIIPAKNERDNIEKVLEQIPIFPAGQEVIFIEGHSNDGTLGKIKEIANANNCIFPIRYGTQKNTGKADAVWTGFELANNDILMILDADATVPPNELLMFYKELITHKGDFINGSRLIYDMEKGAMRKLNYLGNKFFASYLSWICGQPFTDVLCGTKVFFKKDLAKIYQAVPAVKQKDPFCDFTLIIGAARAGLKIHEVPVHYRKRLYGDIQIHRFRDGWKLLKIANTAAMRYKLF